MPTLRFVPYSNRKDNNLYALRLEKRNPMSVEGEPTVPVPATMRTKFYITPEGEPGMIVTIPLGDGNNVHFHTQGSNLETFYLRLREFMEGKGKRPSYLG